MFAVCTNMFLDIYQKKKQYPLPFEDKWLLNVITTNQWDENSMDEFVYVINRQISGVSRNIPIFLIITEDAITRTILSLGSINETKN